MANVNLIANEDSSYTFNYLYYVTKFTFNNFDVSNATDMSYFFSKCKAVTSISNLGINQLKNSKVTNLSYFLHDTDKLSWFTWPSTIDTSHVTDFSYCFYSGCGGGNVINLSSFDTSSAVNMEGMFSYCGRELAMYSTSVKLSNKFNTKNVKNMSKMFAGTYTDARNVLEYLDTSSCMNMSRMFYVGGYLPDWRALDFTQYSKFDTSNVTDMSEMFLESRITNVDISSFSFKSCKTVKGMFWRQSFDVDIYVSIDWYPLPSTIEGASGMFSSKCTIHTK